MFLSDIDTKKDLLNNTPIAETVVSIVEAGNEPISVGIYGEWGTGKSSILAIIEELIKNNRIDKGKRIACVYFNVWKQQGFEDSKVALMTGILAELARKEHLKDRCNEDLKKLWKSINWLSLAKTAGKTAISLATKGDANSLLASTFEDFQESFTNLLDQANLEKLVVLIDDLDRCSPNMVLGVLEAIPLFKQRAAFVIAGDENNIRYAVRKRVDEYVNPALTGSKKLYLQNNYLEDLIHIPIRISPLREEEACLYFMLLMVGTKLEDENENYQRMITAAKERMRTPWELKMFTLEEAEQLLREDYAEVETELQIADRLGRLIVDDLGGNPRRIKKFINTLLIKYELATRRGYSLDRLDLQLMAKLLLAEHRFRGYYKEILNGLDGNGRWTALQRLNNGESDLLLGEAGDQQKFMEWLETGPTLLDVDLRPYFFAIEVKHGA